MGLLGVIGLSLALVSFTQIPFSTADCPITSATPAGPSSILVKWDAYPEATNYLLDLRVINNSNIAPVVVTISKTQTERVVRGLRPGSRYTVTLKVFLFYNVGCTSKAEASTVPDTAQIISGEALSSSSISLEWTVVPSTELYYLVIFSQTTGRKLNLTYTTTSAVVDNLQPSTNFDCYVYTANYAGLGFASKVRTITTLVRPPIGINAVQTGRNVAEISWQPVTGVLMYRVSIRKKDALSTKPTVYNVTALKITVQNILPCSEYLISICSYNMFLVPSEPTDYSYTTNILNPVSTVSLDYSCITGAVTVLWMPVLGADSYKAKAVSGNSTPLICNSTTNSCKISGISCGKNYDVHVTPLSESCENVVNSTSASFKSVPCAPQNLSLLRSCDSEVILFSWNYSDDTEMYKAKSVDSKGVVQECLTEKNSCDFTQTECGRHYYFTVYSMSGTCKSEISSTVDISTAPCIPNNVKTSADCNSNVLLSKWDFAEGALNYTVEAFGNMGNNSYYTCTTQSNSCSFPGISCGESLTIYITSHDNYCSSPKTLAPVAETAPCVPQNVAASTDCKADSITVTWDISGSAIYYIAMARDSAGALYHCNTMDLSCTIPNLKCSTNYTVYVIASNVLCNSSISDLFLIDTVPCPSKNIVTTLDCAKNEALISWTAEPKIKSFTATILDENNGLLSCSSTSTSCVISNLKCHQRYTVTVANHDTICPSTTSQPVYMDSVPCGPTVSAIVDCGTQIMTATWGAVSNATSYKIMLSDGATKTNFSVTNSTFSSNDLHCGNTYTLDVSSIISGCISLPTKVTVTQAPCVPTNVVAQTICQQSFVDVTWQTSVGAVFYKATAVSSGTPQVECTSNGTTCRLENLMCSQTYNATVSASDNRCYSKNSVLQLVTEPCPPSGLVVSLQCANNSAMLTWQSSSNAVSYTGKALSTGGHEVTCSAGANLMCQLDGLQCGQTYKFSVIASDSKCKSAESKTVTYSTAPCPVTNVVNTVDCVNNSLTTTWTLGSMPVNYSVTAVKADNTTLLCETDQSTCVFRSLLCGEQYTVTITPVSSTCSGKSSNPEVVNTAPCVPSNIVGQIQCSDNTLQASWKKAAGATSYLSTLNGPGGFTSLCPSREEACSFINLECAKTYNLSVVASNDRCKSSGAISVRTAPCHPTDVATSLACDSGVATVTWTPSAGAAYYTVLARVNDHDHICGSTGSSCNFTDLHCGQDYTVILLAGDSACNSSILTTKTIKTAPCAPVMQNYFLDCVTNNAVVPWVKDVNAVSVTVSAQSSLGHSTSCSSSTNSSCVLNDLKCGNNYTVTAVAQGVQCLSKASVPFNIVTAPCTPNNVNFVNSCETGIAIVSWDKTLGGKTFYATATSGTDMKSCSTANTECSFDSMLCGHLYDIKVFAIADYCNSSLPGVTQIQTAPCAPQGVAASLMCKDNTGSVSWTASPGAISYKVKALSRDGVAMNCSTNTTTCDVPNMQCAQTYRITVTPFSQECRGYDSQAVSYVAGPCPPPDVTVTRQCNGNVGLVSWTAALNAELYMATATGTLDQQKHNCSSDSTSCSITDLLCGETVNVTVVTKERGCWSEPSVAYTYETVICPPTGLRGVTTCSNNDITVSWDPIPKTGVTYFVQAKKFGGATKQYSTQSTSQRITGLQCGELYTLQVSAQYQECTSVLSESVEILTAPCTPTNLSAKSDCGTSSGTLTWTTSLDSANYTATFTGDHGHVTTCTTNSTTCTKKLDCGHQYTVSLIASSSMCNSSSAATLVFHSAPCLPNNVSATLDCQVNSFTVKWNGSTDDGPYSALAIGSDGSRLSCDTPSTQCTILNLKCGLLYSIIVTTVNIDCGVIHNSDYKIHSAPCKPTTVSVDLDCGTNEAVVSWLNTGPNQTQEVTAQDIRGNTVTCTSSTFNCNFTELKCGHNYNVSVVGKADLCTSDPAYGPMLYTAPCVATHVTAKYDCNTGITEVMWDLANGATSYMVEAKGELGSNAQCENSDTNCAFPSLACGQDYNITVQAHNSKCISTVSETVVTTTGPCPYSGLSRSLDCSTNIALVSWTPGNGTLYYNATAMAFNIDSTETCSSPDSSCNITTLQCGESYKIAVAGQGRKCPSPSQGWKRLQAAPCPPHLLSVDSSCDSNNIVVHWEMSKGSVSYMAVAENQAGEKWMCETDNTSCEITNLPCGQQFDLYVSGLDGSCMGARGNVEVIQTAPCVPQNVQTKLDCPSGSLNVSWDLQGRTPSEIIVIILENGRIIIIFLCKTLGSAGHNCGVPNIPCGRNYDVKLVAKEPKCNSSFSAPKQLSAAPCPLPTFNTTVDCNTGVVSVRWANGVPGVLYSVLAVVPGGVEHTCSSSNGGCNLDRLECGTNYNISITPSRSGCVGSSSTAQVVRTVPCVPKLNEVEIDCLTNAAWIMGTESAGAEDYVITALDNKGIVQTFECNSTLVDMCSLPPLACSMNFSFTVQARDYQCSSAHSNAIMAETGPCSPLNIVSSVNCDNNIISILWDAVPGAVSYTATLEDFNRNTTCCTSSHNSCTISDLPCGQMYTVLLTAEGRTCNSSESREMARTVACVPENLKASLSCSSNVASMSWNHSLGGQLYRVTAESLDGYTDQCFGNDNNCDLTRLKCGQIYTAAVTAEDRDCSSKPSENVTIKTAPCTPGDLSFVMDCNATSLIISWSDSEGADSYLATVEDSYRQITSCQATTEGSCSIINLNCGLNYHVSLLASDGYCDSNPTDVVDTPSVPCEPQHIKAVIDCQLKVALVSWYPSDGAELYVVTATTATGHSATCETFMTYCELLVLQCGDSYSIEVTAVGVTCNSTGHMTGSLVTDPCVPKHITTDYRMSIGLVVWDKTQGAAYYKLEAVTEQGLSSSCQTNDTYCDLYNMQCSQTYNVSVTAYNNVCPDGTPSSETVSVVTEPCPPQDVQASVQCQTNLATVTWEPSIGAVKYEATLAGRNGQTVSCNTVDTFCEVAVLECGVIYYTSVIAIGATKNSTESETIQLVTAPCAVGDAVAFADCHNSSALITWSTALGASSYEMIATATNGHQEICDTSENECKLFNLECGQTYSIKSVTISELCQIVTDTGVNIKTRPCKPLNVEVDQQCGTGTATLFWEDEEGVDLYNATATSSTGDTRFCNSTSSPCTFSSLACGETYNFHVEATNDMCSSEKSNTVDIQTDPCQPTNLDVQGLCNNDTVALSWLATRGALLYNVEISGNLGYVTSVQTNNTRIEADLPCGQLYNFTVQAEGNRCLSTVSQSVQHQNGPCNPQDVQSYIQCENNMGAISWAPSDGADYYIAFAVGDGHTHICTTNTTTCTWNNLHCGDFYTVYVTAHDNKCDSKESNSTTIRMAPCKPQGLVSTLNCSMKVGYLSWDSVATADYYIVTAESNSDHKISVSTNETQTYISEFMCGDEYFLSVQSVDAHCTSGPSEPSKLQSEPCPPTGIRSFMNCVSNIAVVSWNGSAGADYYYATVTLDDGSSLSCWSDNDQCGIPNLRCGQLYNVSVVASNEACNSDSSEHTQLESVPCVPTTVQVSMECANNQAVVSWDASQGALMYKVTALSNNATASCETNGLTCTLKDLVCGTEYRVKVVAMDNICSSLPSPATLFNSVPCTADLDPIVVDCVTNSALVKWTFADGALNYTATASSSSGLVSSCSTNTTDCEILDLECGHTYNVVVQAVNQDCKSPSSNSQQFDSVPCPPQDLTSSLDCPTNTIEVGWQLSLGADVYYVEALGVEEHESACSSDSNSCVLEDLLCGFTYNISVTAVNDFCNMSSSPLIQQNSVPCVPQNVRAEYDCENKQVDVTWETSPGAVSYSVVTQGSGGFLSICDTSDTWCTFYDLSCSMNYSITVLALDDKCSSPISVPIEIRTGLCEPQSVTAKIMCNNDTGVVSWEEGEGVSSYSVKGYGPDGHIVSCNTVKTSCELPSMHCGQNYNLTVTANDGRCDNSQAHLSLNSVPCNPTNVRASLLCHLNSAAVTWEPASGALSYLAVGVSANGSLRSECNNNETNCDLTGLTCGTVYSVTVYGRDDSCSSVKSSAATVHTAPCAPQDVVVSEKCADRSMSVSWSTDMDTDAQYFNVAAVSKTGARLNCNTTSTSCSLTGLLCGQTYNVTVTAVRDGCESFPSAVVQSSSAPCVPTNIKGNLDCVSNSAWITWDVSQGANSYFVWAQALKSQHNSSCNSPTSPCIVPDLKCGATYNITVTAKNAYCPSTPSPIFQIETAPCALKDINTVTQCDSSIIVVEWQMSDNMPMYVATAEGHDLSQLMCNSTSSSCELTATCGTHYTVIVSTASDKCSSLRSPPHKIDTAPCAPKNVTTAQTCDDNGVMVSYELSAVATSYRVEAQGNNGYSATCETTYNNCTLPRLPCGVSYSLTVYALTENCTSPGTTVTYESGPCPPTGVHVAYDCKTLSAVVSWDPSVGTNQYYVSAQTLNSTLLYCTSTGTSCTINGLQCGYTYNFTVEASNNVCNSSFGGMVEVGAVPCAPSGIHVRMQEILARHWARIYWNRVVCPDVEYEVKIVGRVNNNPQSLMEVTSYWYERPYFETPLPCSSTYEITIHSRNKAGVSLASDLYTGVTVPCPPQNAVYNKQTGVVTWGASVLANHYSVYENLLVGKIGLCETALLTCTAPGVDPSLIVVTASNTAGSSLPSSPTVTANRRRRDLRGPELVLDQNLQIPEVKSVTANGNSLYMQWSAVNGAAEYILVIEEMPRIRSGSEPLVQTVAETYHAVTGLKYNAKYCVRVAAKNITRQSHYSKPQCRNTK